MANKILFVTSEAYPLIKTGGLADVSGSLPIALKTLRNDIRVIMPGYRAAIRQAEKLGFASFEMEGIPPSVRLLEGRLPGSSVKLLLVDSAELFDRSGGPYINETGHDWPDNPERFALFCQVATAVARNKAGLDWQPEIVHCNDWQSGLVPALLSQYPDRPATIFTIHNLAYHGHFGPEYFDTLDLPKALHGMHGVEFHGGLSFIKGGLHFADMINTVSPTYAQEIRTPAFGYGMEGLLNHRADRLVGILNGVDYKQWDPESDPLIPHHFSAKQLDGKAQNKLALQQEFGLPQQADVPLLGLVGRLVEQKGIDLVLSMIPQLVAANAQLVVLGTGHKHYQHELEAAARSYPHQIAVHIGFSEALAHRVEAGADLFLMPSRFEPCGLNQIYSLRYGTLPIVRRTGGLADTVVDAHDETITDQSATGFVFEHATGEGLWWATERALQLYHQQPETWQQMIRQAMSEDFSWRKSARHYQALYEQALRYRHD